MTKKYNLENEKRKHQNKGLLLLGALSLTGILTIGYCSNQNLKQKTQNEIFIDFSKIRSVENYALSRDSIYKKLGIDKIKYSQKELDSLLSKYAMVL